jgi:predicted DNA-binding transcriptional regulator AlpA
MLSYHASGEELGAGWYMNYLKIFLNTDLTLVIQMTERMMVNAEDAARLCGISKRHWNRLVSEGTAPRPIKFSRRLVRWRLSDLKEWVNGLSRYEGATKCKKKAK